MPSFTLEEVCRETIAHTAAAGDLGLPLVFSFVERRYREFSNRVHLRHLRFVGEVTYPGPVTGGTVTVTQGSNIVTGTVAGAAKTNFTRNLAGWYFRFNTNWYRIDDVQPSTQTLVLHSPFVETVTAVSGYTIVQRFLPLDRDVRWIETVTHPRLFRILLERTLNWLDSREPSRILVAAFPTVWAEGPAFYGQYGTTFNTEANTLVTDRRKTLEIYPYSTQQEFFNYIGWERLPSQGFNDFLPPELDPYVLMEGAKIDVYEYRAMKALQATPPQAEVATVFQRFSLASMKIWEEKLQQATVADLIALDEDVQLWTDYDLAQLSDIDSAYDNYVSRLGIVVVQ